MADSNAAPNMAIDDPTVHHVSARKRRDIEPGSMQLNLTAMIDVIFQLLIYFVVTASFAVGEGTITAKLPQGTGTPSTDPKPPERPLEITINSVGGSGFRIQVPGSAPATFTQLQETLIGLQHDPERGRSGVYKADNPVLIKPDGQVRWIHVVNAFNAAVAARYSNVSFAQASQ